ncbi:MAG: hypothetical protein DRR19_11490 [Candidatus Parabeggiatoa sp. nov. 1]|nr:MAG: hypothetical protein DRR19_11490 [Gammaproteobacteria bacterium]
MDQSIEQDNDRLSRLEDWLIQYVIENKQVTKELRQSSKKHDEEMADFRQSMAESSNNYKYFK